MKLLFKKIVGKILEIESRLVLWKYKPKIIAITGSVGKTSTKDTVYAVIASMAYVRKSEKSYNSEIGLPLTILGVPNGWTSISAWLENIMQGLWLIIWPHKYPKWLVLEVGVGKPGDMKKTASWLKTDVVVITAIGETPAHIEFFDSRKHLIEEKSGLIKTLKKEGILILNADDEAVMSMKSKTKNLTYTYGFSTDANLVGSSDAISYSDSGAPVGITYRVDVDGKSLPVVIDNVFGRNHIYASLGALAVSYGLKLNILTAISALKNYEVSPGRMRLLAGINGTHLIDDTYNSSPFACEAALKTLRNVTSVGRKIAILGDMLELGKHTKEAHENIGAMAKENVDMLAVVGPRAESIKEGAIAAGMPAENIFQFLDSNKAGEYMKNIVKNGDLVLIKGSQGMRMERVTLALLEDKANKEKLLVRQDKEWQKR